MSRSISGFAFFAAGIACCLCSCAIATFEPLAIASNVEAYGQIIGDEGAWISFSAMPDKACVERLIELTCEGSSTEAVTSWDGQRVTVSPEAGWRMDRKYRIAISGSVRLADGRRYECSFERFFYWASADGFLTVTGTVPAMGAEVPSRGSLSISFNKAIDENSFLDGFRIQPFCATRVSFSTDRRSVTVEPSTRWSLNEIYTWSVEDALSSEGNPLAAPFESRFLSPVDLTFPEVTAVCPVTVGPGTFAFDESSPIDGRLVDDQPFGVVFSEDMSPSSVLSALAIEPSIKGYFAKDGASDRRFVFHPQEPYGAGVKYTLRVASSASDALGLAMRRDWEVPFSSLNRPLRVLSVALPDGSTIGDLAGKDSAHECSLTGDTAEIAIDFSSSIGADSLESTVGKIRLSALFPRTSPAPSLVAARWENGAKRLVTEWKGLVRGVGDIDTFYALEVAGGKSGVTDGRGQCMEDGVCVLFYCR